MSGTRGQTQEAGEAARLLDENEQLRTALETSLEENTRITEDRDRLLRRVTELARELQRANTAHARWIQQQSEIPPDASAQEKRSQTEEELRVAFEELQVLTEELEVANTSLHQTNIELDARVAERTGELAAANASLRVTEAALRAIADLVPDLLWRTDRAGEVSWYNKRWYDYTGQTAEQALGFGWMDAVHPADRAVSRATWLVSVANGSSYEREHRILCHAGHYRWFLVRAEPLRDDSGAIAHWFGSVTDIHDHRVAMEALETSERRFRTLIEGIPQLVWRAVDGGKWTWSSPQWADYTGVSEEESRVSGWLRAVHPDDRDGVKAAWARADAGEPLEIECRVYHAREGRHRHFRSRATPVPQKGGGIEWLGTSTDVDDLLQLQEQQSVLVAELQHRTRNLMAVVQSITLRTIKGSKTLEDFRDCIADRLAALARVQGLLSRREEGMRVTFDMLVREELSAHVALDPDGNGRQVTTRGPLGIQLRSATVQTFALALHELATNAVKYGALSKPDGHLDVCWCVEAGEAAASRLLVEWRESGVQDMPDPGASPRGGGYGRELIERALPFQLGARTSYAFAEDGVHCSIDMPVPAQEIAKERVDG